MLGWKNEIQVKDLLIDDATDDDARRIGQEVYNRLHNLDYMKGFWEMEEFSTVEDVEYFDFLMDCLYYYADTVRILVK